MNMHLTLNAHFKGANNLVQYMYFFRLDKNGYLLIAILSFVLYIIEYNVLDILLHLTLPSEVFFIFLTKTIGHFSHSGFKYSFYALFFKSFFGLDRNEN